MPTLPRGATIGRYVVLGLVGRGGMGEVYAAYDPELDRKVAVKLLRVKPGNGVSRHEGRQRTLREAQAIARLSHPNVVVVFDVGTFHEQVFIAMEFVDGNTVTYWLQAAARSWQEIVKVFMAAGRGLAAAHEKGLVHRDFKPDNVMVGRDSQVRVMDFGLARQMTDRQVGARRQGRRRQREVGPRVVSETSGPRRHGAVDRTAPVSPTTSNARRRQLSERTPSPTSTSTCRRPSCRVERGRRRGAGACGGATMFEVQLTRTGAMMGTPAYMAPEQFLGTPTDARTDQFSFCVALYEALYGERPFAGNTMYALTNNVVQGKVRDAPANAEVPLWIRKILLRGLRPTASERFPSMGDLLDALGQEPGDEARTRSLAAVASAVLTAVLTVGIQQSLADAPRGLRRRPGEAGRRLGAVASGRARAGPARAHQERLPAHRQELRRRRARDGQPRADRLRAELGEHVRGGVRGDAGPRRAVGGGARPADGLPARAPGRPARAHGRVQRGER